MTTNLSSEATDQSGADERAKFEAWHGKNYIGTDTLEWDGDGYCDFDHNRAWKAWQAALASIQPATEYRPSAANFVHNIRNAALNEAANLCESSDQEHEIGKCCAVAIRQKMTATPQSFPAPEVQSIVQPEVQAPIYQIRLPNTPDKYKYRWSDASEDAYWLTDESNRRIVYAAPIVATVPSEPTLYQSRMRPMWRDAGQGWTVWEDCSKASYESVLRLPNMELNDWQYEARKLFDHAAPSTAAEQASDVRNADCYSHNDGDSWCDCPDDIVFVHGLKVGDEYEVLASVRAWTERYRVTKAPDDDSDDYEVELVTTPADKGNAPVEAKS